MQNDEDRAQFWNCAPSNLGAPMSGYLEPWHEIIISEGVTPDLPGIYEWRIEGVGSYIGKYTHSRRPLKEYAKHVRNQFHGGHYRPNNPLGWRRIHVELYQACMSRKKIELIFIENCLPQDLNERENFHIARRGTLNGSRLPLKEIKEANVREFSDEYLKGVAYRIGIYAKLCDTFDEVNRHIANGDAELSFGDKFLDDIFFLIELANDSDRLDIQRAITSELTRHTEIAKSFAADVQERGSTPV